MSDSVNDWFSLHLPDSKARTMTRDGYYAARSYLRRVQHVLRLRYAAARINPAKPNEIMFPAIDDIMPEKFQ